jgi:hypothetical protein
LFLFFDFLFFSIFIYLFFSLFPPHPSQSPTPLLRRKLQLSDPISPHPYCKHALLSLEHPTASHPVTNPYPFRSPHLYLSFLMLPLASLAFSASNLPTPHS